MTTTEIESMFACSGCGKLYDSVIRAERCCPPELVFLCGRKDCPIEQRHPDEPEAMECAKGEWA
jgi:hypothetical protein